MIKKLFFIIINYFFFLNCLSWAEIKFHSILSLNENTKSSPEILVFNQGRSEMYISENISKNIYVYKFDDKNEKFFLKDTIQTFSKQINSIDVCKKHNLLIYSIEDFSNYGKIIIYDLKENNVIKIITVGHTPDMIKVNRNCTKILVANEGEEISNGIINPPGSLSIIDILHKQKGNIKIKYDELFFSTNVELKNSEYVSFLETKNNIYINIEPEYIALSQNEDFALITLQENNAIAKVNLINNKIEFIKGIPFKSFQECKIDNTYDKVVNLKYSNILSSYQPDAIVLLDNKKNYFLIAGEGDAKKNDKVNISGNNVTFVSNYYLTKNNKKVMFGSRSIALIDKNINILWDSCDDFATEIEQKHKDFFNNSYKMDKPDISSAYNGSAPEMIKIFKKGSNTFVFTVLENLGGFFVHKYDDVQFKSIGFIFAEKEAVNFNKPEGIDIFFSKDKDFIFQANEGSGSIDVFEIINNLM